MIFFMSFCSQGKSPGDCPCGWGSSGGSTGLVVAETWVLTPAVPLSTVWPWASGLTIQVFVKEQVTLPFRVNALDRQLEEWGKEGEILALLGSG